jgi:uncharacterized repeat protein (TIGR03803 family)
MAKRLLLSAGAFALFFAATVGPAYAQFNVLYNFGVNGSAPNSPLDSGIIVQGRNGNLYTTTPDTATDGLGTSFEISPSGALTVLHRFNGTDGLGTQSGLTLGTDGNFYGTTNTGGTDDNGTIFRMTPSGDVTTLWNFSGAFLGTPTSAPIEGIDGNLYGRTATSSSMGIVYSFTKSGVFTNLDGLPGSFGFGPPFGNGPFIEGTDGFLYGTLFWGTGTDHGTIFSLTDEGAIVTMHRFDITHGIHPVGPLAQGSDGNFYGATYQGGTGPGSFGGGMLFMMMPDETFKTLYNFQGGDDGNQPIGSLIQATDGNFYGTTSGLGTTAGSAIFRLTPEGKFTTLHHFNCATDGCQPMVTLVQHTNGKLYGDTNLGGSAGNGTFFSYDIGATPFVAFLPLARVVGGNVEILGQGFTGTTAVSFNGISASFHVVSDTFLNATVPEGAETGLITVMTPSGTLTSNRKFQVRPTVTGFSPTSGAPGTTVVITGDSFTGTTKVKFGNNKKTTSITVNSDHQLKVVVPVGAATGNISVTTTGAPSFSETSFTVTH